jgi:hypothetical protein
MHGEPPAERLDAVLDAEQAGSAGEVGSAAAVVVHPDLQDGDIRDGVDLDPDGDGRGVGVLGGVRQRLGDDVVGRGLERFGQP